MHLQPSVGRVLVRAGDKEPATPVHDPGKQPAGVALLARQPHGTLGRRYELELVVLAPTDQSTLHATCVQPQQPVGIAQVREFDVPDPGFGFSPARGTMFMVLFIRGMV